MVVVAVTEMYHAPLPCCRLVVAVVALALVPALAIDAGVVFVSMGKEEKVEWFFCRG